MRYLKPINQKADRVVDYAGRQKQDVVALQAPQQPARPHLPMSSYKYLRTITLDADETMDLIVVPADGARTSATQP